MSKIYLLYLLYFLIHLSYGWNSIYITQRKVDNVKSIITCAISGDNVLDYRVYLYCPLSLSGICFNNCTLQCNYYNGKCKGPPKLKLIHKCEYEKMELDHVEVQYHIRTDLLLNNETSKWFCVFKGKKSKMVTIVLPKKSTTKQVTSTRTTTTIKTTKLTTITTKPTTLDLLFQRKIVDIRLYKPTQSKKTKPKVQSNQKQDQNNSKNNAKPNNKPVANSDNNNNDNNGNIISMKALLTKLEFVIVLFCVLVLSIIFNLACCIRESMFKTFIENLKSRVRSHRFLLMCICQNDSIENIATANLDRVIDCASCSHNSIGDSEKYNYNVYQQQYMHHPNLPMRQDPILANQNENGNNTEIGRSQSFQNSSVPYIRKPNPVNRHHSVIYQSLPKDPNTHPSPYFMNYYSGFAPVARNISDAYFTPITVAQNGEEVQPYPCNQQRNSTNMDLLKNCNDNVDS